MSFYDFVKRIKSRNKDKITFVKCGVFFVCIGEDALIASEVLGLKKTCFSKQICKCGMPVSEVVNNLQKIDNYIIFARPNHLRACN